MSTASGEDRVADIEWPAPAAARVPYGVFSDPALYALEHERIFRGPTWNYVCLEAEIPEPGDFRTSWVGEIPVIATRDRDGAIHVLVNRCAHKGALVCLRERGNARRLTCLYHAWSYDLSGALKGIAFRNGVNGRGGMPEDFDPERHRLEALRVARFCGLIFASFSPETPPVEDYLGVTMAAFLRRNFDRPLKLIGSHSQVIHNNWKLYAENIRDSYHATLLHTFYTTFKVNRLDMDGGIILSDDKWHHISYSKRATFDEAAEYARSKVHSAGYEDQLEGPRLLESWEEYEDGITHSIQSVFPNLCLQFTLNSLAIRFFVPRGVDETELFWFYLGCEDDSEEQTAMRRRQANLTGAGGLVSLEDGCINEFVQRGTTRSEAQASFIEMGGRQVESSENSRATEASVRGFWEGYRRIMGFGAGDAR